MFSDTRTGAMLVLSHLAAIAAVLTLILIHVALGARVRRALGVLRERPASWRWPVDATLGAGVLGTVFLVIGALGYLHVNVVLVVTGALTLLVRADLARAAQDLGKSAIRLAGGDRALLGARLLFLLLALLMLAGALGPPADWDSLMYHLRIPLSFLAEGRVGVPEDSFHVALVGISHLSTLPLLAAGILVGPALMQVAAFVLLAAATIALAHAVRLSERSAWIAVAVLIGCPMFVLVAITSRVEMSVVVAAVAAHLVLLTARDEVGGEAALLTLGALLVGIALAIKPQAGAYAIALAPLGWQAARSPRRALSVAGLAALVCAPWYLKNQLLVGAPLYPKGAPGWFEPWLAEIFGGRARPPTVDASILSALPEARASFNILDAFFAPETITIEGEGAYFALSPALLALPLALLAFRARATALGVGLVGILYALIVIVPFGQINLRYLMPAIPALAIALAAGAEELFGRMEVSVRQAAAVVLVLVALAPLPGALRARFLAGTQVLVRHAMGSVSAQQVWMRHPDPTSRAYASVILNVQRLVPPDGRVLMLWEARALPLERNAIADVMLSNWSYLSQSDALERCLAGTGITHVLAGTGSVEYYVERGADPRVFRLDRFPAFRDRCLGQHAEIGPGFALFPLRAAPR